MNKLNEQGQFIFYFTAELEDFHVVELSTRITSAQELLNLGIKGLNLPRHSIQSALYNHKDSIQDAAYTVISDWVKQYQHASEAYFNILASLQKCKMNQLASQLREWAEGPYSTWLITKESKSNDMKPIKTLLILYEVLFEFFYNSTFPAKSWQDSCQH